METNELIALLMLIATICSGITAIISMLIARKISYAQIESSIRQQINTAERHKDSTALEYKRLQIKDNIKSEELELLQCIFDSAVQQLLNVYDDACGLYIDKKLDKTHFIKNYETEIINLVEAECYYEYYYGKYSKFYEKTLNVYKLIKPLKK